MMQFKGQYTDHEVDLLLKKLRPKLAMAASNVNKPSLEQALTSVEAEDDDVFAMFGQFQA